MPSATTSSLRAGCVALLVLGLADLGVLNFYLAPAAFPPAETAIAESPDKPGVAQTPSQPGGVSQLGIPPSNPPPSQTPPTKVAAATPSGDKEAPSGEQAGEGQTEEREPGTTEEQKPSAVAAGTSGGEEAGAGGKEGAGATKAPAPPPIPRKTTILFGTAEYLLSAGGKQQVDRLVAKLALAPAITEIRVEGHADKRGENTFNMALSEKRAQAVAEYLAEKGVAQGKLSSKGLGDQFPMNQGETTAALARNRRVEIIIPQGER